MCCACLPLLNRLVHGDLSEYNLLWYKNKLVFIDVSQSVEQDHPRALEFLRKDCSNIADWFRKRGLAVMSARELFDFVVHSGLNSKAEEEAYLGAMSSRAMHRSENNTKATAEQQVEDAVFMQAYIPRSLADVQDHEQERDRMEKGDFSGVFHGAITGVIDPMQATRRDGDLAMPLMPAAAPSDVPDSDDGKPAGAHAGRGAEAEEDKHEDESDAGGSGDGSEDGSDEEEDEEPAFTLKGSSKDERKAHKAAVKAAAREKRQQKLPKALKKVKINKSKKSRAKA